MKLVHITYFMIIYHKKLKYDKISKFVPDFPGSPDFSDFQDFPDIKPGIFVLPSCVRHSNAQILLADVLTVNLSIFRASSDKPN